MGFLRHMLGKQKLEKATTSQPLHGDDDTTQANAPAPPDVQADKTLISSQKKHVEEQLAKPPITVGCASHVGRVRERNEDSVLVVTSMSLGDSALPPFGLFVVADGVGGHREGHKASQLSARIVARDLMGQIYTPFLQVDPIEPDKPIQDILGEAVQTANRQVRTTIPGSGTTLTAVFVSGNRLYVAHVGDTRAYLFRDKESPAELLTVDHSVVQRLQDEGQITAEEASIHPKRNVICRAVGQGDKLDVDTSSVALPRPCQLLLCTDGLWGVVHGQRIQEVVTAAATPQQACDELVGAALDAGGPDNISIVNVEFE